MSLKIETIPSRKASPLRLDKAVGAILGGSQTAPENSHLQSGFVEIPLKTSRIVKVDRSKYRRTALPYSLTIAVCASPEPGPLDCPTPHSLTLEWVWPLQSLTNW